MLEYLKNRMHGWKAEYCVTVYLTEPVKMKDHKGRIYETNAFCAYGKKKEVECARELAHNLKAAGLAIEDITEANPVWS